MNVTRVLALVVIAAITVRTTVEMRTLWRGSSDYYSGLIASYRPHWLWGDWSLCAFMRSTLAGLAMMWSLLLAVIAGLLPQDLPGVQPTSTVLHYLLPAAMAVGMLVFLAGRPRFLVPPTLRAGGCQRLLQAQVSGTGTD